jgi:hypothetical protein
MGNIITIDLGVEKMTEEVMMIQMISGISCPDGRHFLELVCSDSEDKPVSIILPATTGCGEEIEHCGSCSKSEDCEMQDGLQVDLGRKLAIKR